MVQGIYKLRYLLATRSDLLARACLVVMLFGGLGAGFTFANPPTIETPSNTDPQSIAMALHSQATVKQGSSLYPQEETLTDMPVYVRSHTPTVTLSLVTIPPNEMHMQIDQQLSLVYEARTLGDEVFWKQRQVLIQTNTSTTGKKVVSNATVDITAVDQRVAQIESEIGDAGQIHIYLAVESQYSTPAATGSLTRQGTIRIREDAYEIEHVTGNEMVGTTETAVRVDASRVTRFTLPVVGVFAVPHTTFVFALLSLGGAIGAGAAVLFADRFDPEEEQVALHKARYAEWISEGTIPANLEAQTAVMDTLEDLVDVAIDSEKRIIHDPSQGKYAVFDSQIVYLYTERTEQDFIWVEQ